MLLRFFPKYLFSPLFFTQSDGAAWSCIWKRHRIDDSKPVAKPLRLVAFHPVRNSFTPVSIFLFFVCYYNNNNIIMIWMFEIILARLAFSFIL